MTLEGKCAVVTGGSRGIGAGAALSLMEQGARVVVAARSPRPLDEAVARWRERGFSVWGCPTDVTDPTAVAELARFALETSGPVDLLVNNAGMGHSAPIKRLTLEDWNQVMAVNATSALLCTQAFLPGMLARGFGRIVNVASVASKAGAKYIAAYCASKHALLGLTRACAAEVAGTGVTVNAVCPGYVDTEMTESVLDNISVKTKMARQEALEMLLRTSGQARLITTAEVAHAISSLCHPAASGTNGQSIVLDGGVFFS